jgi:hypothetical protein
MLARHLAIGAVAALAISAPAASAAAASRPVSKPPPGPSAAFDRPGETRENLPLGRDSYAVPEAAASPDCGPHFCVHWVDQGADAPRLKDTNGDGVPDYVERVLAVAEHVHEIENDQMGWREPLSDGTLGGGEGETDVYLAEIGPRLFGYAAPDRGQDETPGGTPRHLHGYLVLDNDYEPFEFPGTTQGRDLKVTFAHEYNHILQFGYEAYEDPWFAESTAVWMEDQVYNGIDDYLRYVRHWVKLAETPLTANSLKMYGSAVWNEWLAHHYGPALIREAWADAGAARPEGFAIAAYEAAIRAAGGVSFGHEFTRFAADVAEWRTGIGFRESGLYPDMPRQGTLEPGAEPVTRDMNHTTFALLGVPTSAGREVEVQVTAPEGVASGLALVGRLGSEREGKTIKGIAYSRTGGTLTARLADPGRYQRITAVVVNADARAEGYSAARLDWNYLAEDEPFGVVARIVR